MSSCSLLFYCLEVLRLYLGYISCSNATECVCPIQLKRQSCKSNNALDGMENVSPLGLVTLTQLTALGLP